MPARLPVNTPTRRIRETGDLVSGPVAEASSPPAAGPAGGVSSPAPESPGHTFDVILIREGLAKTGRYFTHRFVRQVADAAQGLRAFADHPTPTEDRERPVRSIRDVVGFYSDARVVEAQDPATGDWRLEAHATLHLFPSAAWLAAIARETLASACPDVIGLSIDAFVVPPTAGRPAGLERDVPVVDTLLELRSVDVVTRPSAGGAFTELLESESESLPQPESTPPPDRPTAPDQETPPVMTAAPTAAADSETAATASAAAEAATAAAAAAAASAVTAEAELVLAEARRERFALRAAATLSERLAAADRLTEATRAKLRKQLAPTDSTPLDLDAYTRLVEDRIADEVEAADADDASLRRAGAAGLVTGMGHVRLVASGADSQRLAAQLAMDRLFALPATDDDPDVAEARRLGLLPSVPRWSGIKEAYVQLTGDSYVSGTARPDASIVREANEVTTGVLNMALLNSMTKRLVQDYRGQEQSWRKFCDVVPVENFKSQDRVRLHDFSSLATVAEGAAYANLAWDDSRETYTPAKRGNLVVVTREAIVNDDIRAIRKIPQKLARAAGITINEFVFGLFTTNPLMNDGSKVFDDGVQATHGNRGTTALSAGALTAAITSMMKQTDSAGKRLNLRPRYLLVPADLLFTALTIVNSTLIPGSANNDANVLKGAVEPIPVAQMTDVTDYYLICDPKDIESIEIGFVHGREEPELLVQDAPLLGQVFTNDQISFKVRWEFGGGWLDYRGAFWGNVAG